MPELENVLRQFNTITWWRPGIRLEAIDSNMVPHNTIFMNAENSRICYKNENGTILKLKMELL